MIDLPGLYHHPNGAKSFSAPPWTPEQVQRLLDGKRRGEREVDIAAAIGRTKTAVTAKWRGLRHA